MNPHAFQHNPSRSCDHRFCSGCRESLGNIESKNGLTSLSYQLNNAPEKDLIWGSDLHRLAAPGDFNVDIDTSILLKGKNQLTIIAENTSGYRVKKEVVVHFESHGHWPLPYEIKWSEVDQLQMVVQIVDGHWEITTNGLHNLDTYYDRVVAFGDGRWQNYEC